MNYILRYKGAGIPDAEKLKKVLDANNISIIDGSALPTMAKVSIRDMDISSLKPLSQEWDLFPEKEYSVPTTKRKPK
ncbi:MAG: hypothetical protein ACJ75B_14655 [Flavisolibacter sp.]